VADAFTRAQAYLKAGADGIMIHSREKSPAEVFEFCRLYNGLESRKPLVAVPSSYNKVTEEELADNGVNVVIYANQLIRSAYPAMVRTAKSILEHHRSAEADAEMMSIKEILELIPGGK
jgi:phosphoenolpyruvate phosphomutase